MDYSWILNSESPQAYWEAALTPLRVWGTTTKNAVQYSSYVLLCFFGKLTRRRRPKHAEEVIYVLGTQAVSQQRQSDLRIWEDGQLLEQSMMLRSRLGENLGDSFVGAKRCSQRNFRCGERLERSELP